MAKVSIRVGFNQSGFLHSVKNVDTGVITSYIPGAAMPVLGAPCTSATSACQVFRVWQLTDDVVIENQHGLTMYEGCRGDYLFEAVDGSLSIVKVNDVRDGFDLSGEVSKIFRTPLGSAGVLEDKVVGKMKDGQEF